MSLNFPNNPVVGDTHNGINNIQYVFDGEKWTTVGSTAGPSPSFDAITVTGVATFDGEVKVGNDNVRLTPSGSIIAGNSPSDIRVNISGTNGNATFDGNVTSKATFLNELQGGFVGTDSAYKVFNGSTTYAEIKNNGSATFDGGVQAGGNAQSGAAVGTRLNSYGAVHAARTNDSDVVWSGYKVGTSTGTSEIRADGSATFAGSVTSGNTTLNVAGFDINVGDGTDNHLQYLASSGLYIGNDGVNNNLANGSNIRLNNDGSATFSGGITTDGGVYYKTLADNGGINLSAGKCHIRQDGSQEVFAVYSGGGATSNIVASINGDGSATFAGNLENTGYMFNINPSDSYAGIYLYQGKSGGDLTRAALQISSTTSDADTTATINYDGSATFAGNVQGAYFTGVQDSANSAVFRGTYTGSPNAFNTVIYGDGSATFAGGLVRLQLLATTHLVQLVKQSALGLIRLVEALRSAQVAQPRLLATSPPVTSLTSSLRRTSPMLTLNSLTS